MDTPKPPAFSIQDTDGNKIAKQQGVQDSDTESLGETIPTRTISNPEFKELDRVDVIRPFLEWLVLDDFGNRDESAPEIKVNRFLSAIYHSLSANCVSQNATPAPQVAHTAQTHPTGQTSQAGQSVQVAQTLRTQVSGNGRPNILIVGRTSKDVDDLTYKLQQEMSGSGTIIEQQLRKAAAKLFQYYVPTTHNETIPPVRLFWGLVYELIVSSLCWATTLCAKISNRSIANTCKASARRSKILTNGPNDYILGFTTSVVVSMIQE